MSPASLRSTRARFIGSGSNSCRVSKTAVVDELGAPPHMDAAYAQIESGSLGKVVIDM
jgi:hypothetical protein